MRAYKNLEEAERAFGSLKGPELQIRPIHHRLADRVRAHLLICMLADDVTWHLNAAWKPCCSPTSTRRPVPTRSPKPSAPRRATQGQTKRTSTGEPCHSYESLLAELATQTRNTTRLAGSTSTFEKLTRPTELQADALDLAEHAPVVVKR